MLLRKKRLQSRLKIVSVIALVCIGVLAFAANAYASNVPSASFHQSSQNQSLSLSQKPATWITQPEDLSGKTVHFTQISSTYTKGGQGLGDGRKVQGDIWENIGPNGQVTAFHGVYTSLDGKTFYQEIFENTVTRIIVIGKHTPGIPATWFTATQCIMQSPATIADLASLLPPFENEQSLNTQGFHMSSSVQPQPPVVTPLHSGISPLETYNANGNIHVWTRTMPFQNSFIQTQQEEISSQSRTLLTSNKITDKTGVVVNSTSTAFGVMYVYSSSLVPSSLFTAPQTTGGCTR